MEKLNIQEASDNNGIFASVPKTNDPVELWAFYNRVEKEAREAKNKIAADAINNVSETNNKFVRTPFSGVQMIEKVTRKPKDSLKFVLQQSGYYDLCRKDEVDLKKVDELVKAGMIDKQIIDLNIETNRSMYLKAKE